jgi:uncharacterized circularly permuted ATP-grasp superfamily protein
MKITFDEMFDEFSQARPHYFEFNKWLTSQSDAKMALKRSEADMLFRRIGITFAIYGDEKGTERTIPFDQIPRIIPHQE